MKEVRLWEISKSEQGETYAKPMDSVSQTKTEDDLESLLVRCPDLLFDDLRLIGRQTETAGGPLDLLGVDADGHLVIFELKRGTLTRDAVSQVIDYASYLAELDHEELSRHISERSGHLEIDQIDDFQSWYQEQFSRNLEPFQRPRMVLVGLGADDRTRRMVSFLADSDIDISLITFYGFEKDGNSFLAKQIEVEAKPPTATTVATKKGNLEKLQKKVSFLQLESFYYILAEFFRDKLLPAYEWPNPGGYAYSLLELTESGNESYRVYVALYIYDYHPGKVEIRIHPRAVEAATESFESFKRELNDGVKKRIDGGYEIWISSLKDWEMIKPHFENLCPAVVSGWRTKREQRVIEEQEAASTETEINDTIRD
jgi:hypothetical protein